MDTILDWRISSTLANLVDQLIAIAPRFGAAVVLMLIGWLVARVLRAVAVRLGRGLDGLTHHLARHQPEPRSPVGGTSAELFGGVVFWVVILFFLTTAAQVLGVEAFTNWLDQVVSYLPTIFAGVLIVAAGFVVSIVARDLVAAAAPASMPQRLLLARLTQAVIFATAAVVGIDQIGIEVRFLVVLAAVIAGVALGGFAVAFSLGAQSFIANLIGAHQARQAYEPGQRIRVAGHEGRIIEISQTNLLLDTAEGHVTLPARMLHEHPVVRLDERPPE